MENIEYNRISNTLKKTIPTLKKGQKLVFELLGIYYDEKLKRVIIPNSVRISSTDRIWDPGDKKDGSDARWVDIAFVTGQRPGVNGKTEYVFGELRFTRTGNGRITIIGGNKRDEQMLLFLWLTNYNASNKDKDYHVPLAPEGYKFKVLDPKTDAQKSVKKDKAIRAAKDVLDDMDSAQLLEIARGLQLARVNQFSDEEEILAELYKFAESDPELILRADQDVGIKLVAFIQTCVDKGVIGYDGGSASWRWSGSNEAICPSVPGKSPEVSFKDFLISEAGSEVLKTLEQYVNGAASKTEEDE